MRRAPLRPLPRARPQRLPQRPCRRRQRDQPVVRRGHRAGWSARRPAEGRRRAAAARRRAPAGRRPRAVRSAPAGRAPPPARRAPSAPAPARAAKSLRRRTSTSTSPGRSGRPWLSSGTAPSVSAGDPVGQRVGKALRRAALAADCPVRHRPGLGAAPRRAPGASGHSSTRSGMAGAIGDVAQRRPARTTPAAASGLGEHRIDQRKHRRRWSGRTRSAATSRQSRRPPHAAAEPSRQHVELAGIGALERVDRLLAVADREHGAMRLARRPAPAKNSPSARPAISHCAGAVSCTSSSSRWSSPPSSL